MYHPNPTDSPAARGVQRPAQAVVVDIVDATGTEAGPPGTAHGGDLPAELEKQIAAIEKRLDALDGKPADDLDADIGRYGRKSQKQADVALSAAYYAIIYAWATGCLFNLAKKCLPRGPFGKWRDTKADELGISVKTGQNWMNLARSCSDVRALLKPGATLTGAYRATGVLPEPDAPDECNDAHGDSDRLPDAPSHIEPVFVVLAEARKRLRHLLESDEFLNADDRDRLEEEKTAIITLIDNLLNQSTAPIP